MGLKSIYMEINAGNNPMILNQPFTNVPQSR